jgi:hypothetical protein
LIVAYNKICLVYRIFSMKKIKTHNLTNKNKKEIFLVYLSKITSL